LPKHAKIIIFLKAKKKLENFWTQVTPSFSLPGRYDLPISRILYENYFRQLNTFI